MTPAEQAKTMSMVERVARAIYQGTGRSWDIAEHESRQRAKKLARAAIEAWKEVTDAEIDAAIEKAGIPWGFGHTEGRQFINALVDAALSEEGE